MLHHLFESELCSVFTVRSSVLRAGLPDVMEDGDEDSLRGLTLECKPASVFGLSRWQSQLQLMGSSYRGQSDSVSEILRDGAPDEVTVHAQESWIAASPGRGSVAFSKLEHEGSRKRS